MLSNRCAYCDLASFKTRKEYADHMRREEVAYRRKIVTTPEQKKEIVARVEERLKSHIVSYGHESTCRCEDCFNARLDKILEMQNANTEREVEIPWIQS